MFINKFSSKSRNSLIAHSNVSTNKCYTYCSEKKKKCFRSKVPLCLEKVAFCAIHLTSKTYQFNLDLKRISSSSGINAGSTFINFGFFSRRYCLIKRPYVFQIKHQKSEEYFFLVFSLQKGLKFLPNFPCPTFIRFVNFGVWSI